MILVNKISAFNRARKWQQFIRYINPSPQDRVLDVGFSEQEYRPTCNYIEKHYPFPQNLTAISVDRPNKFSKRYPLVIALQYDGKVFPFAEKHFDICWSNAVIEHVGGHENQIAFLKQIKTVAKTAFITTPNKYFPIEVHTHTPLLHYLPQRLFYKYLSLTGKGWATQNYMNLLSLRKIKQLLHFAGIQNYKIIKNRLGPFTLDFVIIIK